MKKEKQILPGIPGQSLWTRSILAFIPEHPQLPSAPQCLKEADGKDPHGIRGFHQAAPLISESSLAIITGETWIRNSMWASGKKPEKRPSSYLLPPGAGTLSLSSHDEFPNMVQAPGTLMALRNIAIYPKLLPTNCICFWLLHPSCRSHLTSCAYSRTFFHFGKSQD